KKKISIIFFTYKRAILLDAALKSLINNSEDLISYPINIIYHHDKYHDKSYKLLNDRYKNKVKFYKREKKPFHSFFLQLLRPLNFIWLLRYPSMMRNFTNFKEILETILKKNTNDLVMLCTDDTIFYKKIKIPQKILKEIIRKKNKFFFRTNFGLKLKGLYSAKKNSYNFTDASKKIICWNSKNKNLNFHMKYHFQVEGAIYHKKSLHNFLKPVLYHNPVTLEAIGYREAKLRNYFLNTFSGSQRTAVTYEINSVQNVTDLRYNYRIQLNPFLMMKAYINNYVLCNLIPYKERNFSKIIPKVVYVVKQNNKNKNKNKNKKNILTLKFKK
ncbi:hypothetical protein, partial [Candidatus Pelagibacter sp.]|uniref:hypothetical protein n=1 Tax=Candidatus Pelagibacter sp. TaxID=2024849 RepID=UPI003F8403B3